MIRAAIYTVSTGVILQMLEAETPEAITAALLPGQAVAVAPPGVDYWSHYVKGGVFKPYPAMPGGRVRWNPTTEAWEDPRAIAQIRTDAKSAMNAARIAADGSGFTALGFTFQSDDVSRGKIGLNVVLAALALLNKTAFSVTWTTADNVDRTLTAAQWATIGSALGDFLSSNNAKLRAKKAAIDAASTSAAVQAITWG